MYKITIMELVIAVWSVDNATFEALIIYQNSATATTTAIFALRTDLHTRESVTSITKERKITLITMW